MHPELTWHERVKLHPVPEGRECVSSKYLCLRVVGSGPRGHLAREKGAEQPLGFLAVTQPVQTSSLSTPPPPPA